MSQLRQLVSRFALKQADRLVLFVSIFWLVSVLFTIEYPEPVTSMFALSCVIAFAWTGLHCCFAVYFGYTKWLSTKRNWIALVFILLIDAMVFCLVTWEVYEDSEIDRWNIVMARESWLAITCVVSALIFGLTKIGSFTIDLMPRMKWGRWVFKHVGTRAGKVTIVLLALILIHYLQQLLALGIGAPHRWSLDLILDSGWFWFGLLPFVLVFPPFLIGRLIKTWWIYGLSMLVFLLIVFFIETFVGAEFPSLRSLLDDHNFYLATLIFAYLFGLALILPKRRDGDYDQERPNLASGVVYSTLALVMIAVALNFNLYLLLKWQNSSRWQVARATAFLSPHPTLTIRYQEERGDEFFDQWIETEKTIRSSDGADCLGNLPDLPGTLTLVNLRPDVNTAWLGALKQSAFVFKGGTINFEQLEAVSDGSGNYPVLQDVVFENKTGFEFDSRLGLVYESSSPEATSSMLAAMEKTKFTSKVTTSNPRGTLTLKLEHELSADDWLRMSNIATNTNESITFLVFLCFGDVERNREAFRNLPPNYRLPASLIFHKSETDPQIFSQDQIRHLLEGEFNFAQMDVDPWNRVPIAKTQFQTAFDLAFAAKRRSGGLSIEPDAFIESLLTSKFKSVNEFHWSFATDDLNEQKPHKGLALPVVTDKTLRCAAENFPELEVLCLGNHLLPLVYIGPGSAGDNEVSLEPISKLSNLKELLISVYDDYKSFSSLSSLANLRKLYLYECPEDLSWVGDLKNLEFLVLNIPELYDVDETFGFIAQQDSRIKSITLFGGMPTDGFLREIAKLPNLEDMTVVHERNLSPYQVLRASQRAKQFLNNVKVVNANEFGESLPDAYRNHRQRIKKMVRVKYLGEKPRL